MAIKKYYDSDCNLGVLDGKTVAVIGFGSQGHAHSENLAESGVNVVVGLRKGSAHWEKASEFAATHPNFKVMEVEEAAKAGDVVMMLVPDELCADIYNKQVAPYMTEGKALAFAKAFYGRIYGYAHTGWNTLYEWNNSICSLRASAS